MFTRSWHKWVYFVYKVWMTLFCYDVNILLVCKYRFLIREYDSAICFWKRERETFTPRADNPKILKNQCLILEVKGLIKIKSEFTDYHNCIGPTDTGLATRAGFITSKNVDAETRGTHTRLEWQFVIKITAPCSLTWSYYRAWNAQPFGFLFY